MIKKEKKTIKENFWFLLPATSTMYVVDKITIIEKEMKKITLFFRKFHFDNIDACVQMSLSCLNRQ